MSSSSLPQSGTGNYLRRSAFASLLNSGSSALATALLLPLVIRHIGMDAYGLWAVLGIFIGVASALDLGIWKALVYLLPRGVHSGDELISSAIVLCLLTGTVFALLLAALLLMNVPLFGAAVAAHSGLEIRLTAAGVAVVFCCLLTNLARGVLESEYCGPIVNVGYAVLTLLLYGVPAVISRWTVNPQALIAGSVAVYSCMLIAHVICVLRVLRVRRVRLVRPTIKATRAILHFGIRSFIADAPSIALGPTLLYLFVLFSSDAAQFGVFEIALKIATLAATALGLLSTPFFALAANAQIGQQAQVRQMAARFLRVTIPLAAMGWLIYSLIGQSLLVLFFAARDTQLFHTSLIVLAGMASSAALEPIARMQMGMARLQRLFWVRLTMLVVALTGVVTLSALPLLDRFAISAAAGFGTAACGLLWINRIERRTFSANQCA